jgi:hypothetical protein
VSATGGCGLAGTGVGETRSSGMAFSRGVPPPSIGNGGNPGCHCGVPHIFRPQWQRAPG